MYCKLLAKGENLVFFAPVLQYKGLLVCLLFSKYPQFKNTLIKFLLINQLSAQKCHVVTPDWKNS